jgi:beta-lactamase superfamily II metal-dependent hydrolase
LNDVFTVTLLPAKVGDAIWIEYGDPHQPNRILIDAGTAPTAATVLRDRIASLPDGAFDLFVVTHIDTDHIGGAVPLLESITTAKPFQQIWFNGWRHLEPNPSDLLGPRHGERLTKQILRLEIPWNRDFAQGKAPAKTSEGGALPVVTLPGGMNLTLLSPRQNELDLLRPVWEPVIATAGLLGGTGEGMPDFEPNDAGDILGGDPLEGWAAHDPDDLDDTESNGSSIAFLAEFEGMDAAGQPVTKSCLFSGDGHGSVLTEGIKRLARERGQARLLVDAFKLPHHGSVRNVTKDLIEAVDAGQYLVSTDSGGNYGHPHQGAIARAILHKARPVVLRFNYPKNDKTKVWDNIVWKVERGYATEYGTGELTITL